MFKLCFFSSMSTVPNPCVSLPCQNGGTCVRTGDSSYVCSCLAEFTGTQCIFSVDPTSKTGDQTVNNKFLQHPRYNA